MNTTEFSQQNFNATQFENYVTFVRDMKVPADLKDVHASVVSLIGTLAGKVSKCQAALSHLRRALGILPKSEKQNIKRDGKGCKKPAGELTRKDYTSRVKGAHKNLSAFDNRQKKMNEIMKSSRHDDIKDELSAEDERRINEQTAFVEACMDEGADEPIAKNLLLAPEALFEKPESSADAELLSCNLDDKNLSKDFSKITKTHRRYEFELKVSAIDVEVETAINRKTGETVRADTSAIGPSHWQVTWAAVATLIRLAIGYVIPINRLDKMLGQTGAAQYFSAATNSRILEYAASRFLPVYLYLFDSLKNSLVLMGDDTPVRVVEVMKWFAANPETRGEKPWKDFTIKDDDKPPDEKIRLAQKISEVLGFETQRVDGTGAKVELNTSVVIGKADGFDASSYIVFYRTHLGSFGNLLDVLLERRTSKYPELYVLSDLSSKNRVRNEAVTRRIKIHYAGCGSHARRSFVQSEKEDPDACGELKACFYMISQQEKFLDFVGRREKNVRAVRQKCQVLMWERILRVTKAMAARHSNSSTLGVAARYVISNYEKLTKYLSVPELSWTNNFSERMLRAEKQMAKSSFFRFGLNGRAAWDVLRTVLQTSTAAGVQHQDYLLYVLKANPKDVEQHPEKYTPLAFKKNRESNLC